MQGACIEPAARLECAGIFIEYLMAVGVYEGCQRQPDELFARIAVHRTRRRVRLHDKPPFQVADDQPVIGSVENTSILPVTCFRWGSVRAFLHTGCLLLENGGSIDPFL
jgi:hypothetical protein